MFFGGKSWVLDKRDEPHDKRAPCGRLTGLYLLLSGIGRFLVEFVRINPKIYFHGTMSNAQVAAAASAIVGLVVIGVAQARHSGVVSQTGRRCAHLSPTLPSNRRFASVYLPKAQSLGVEALLRTLFSLKRVSRTRLNVLGSYAADDHRAMVDQAKKA